MKRGHLYIFYRYRETKRKLVSNVRDVLIQEIMTISGSEFEGEAIDMDSVAFAGNGNDLIILALKCLTEIVTSS